MIFFRRARTNSGLGQTDGNGIQCVFAGLAQRMHGNAHWDRISSLNLYLLEALRLTGTVLADGRAAAQDERKRLVEEKRRFIHPGYRANALLKQSPPSPFAQKMLQ